VARDESKERPLQLAWRRLIGRLPGLAEREVSTAQQELAGTRLHGVLRDALHAHPGKSGIVQLRDGYDALAARILLADAAERTLDLQYYIWRNDRSGALLFDAVRRAADRGVRVRIQLDDNNTAGMDTLLRALDAHPRIEIRLFNPFVHRRLRALGFLTDFARLNRRMHNKSFTVDNQVTLVGGRNIGDEYFDAHKDISFVDLDVLAVGPVVQEVSRFFDAYWSSDSSYPAERILGAVEAQRARPIADAALALATTPAAVALRAALDDSPLVAQLLDGTLEYRWAVTHMFCDHPAKALDRAPRRSSLLGRLRETLGAPERELQLVSPYLVPTRQGLALLTTLARGGVKLSILTNSLEATDVAIVHAGYSKRRRRLLRAGIALHELQRTAPRRSRRERRKRRDRRITGSPGSSLHAKTFAIDRTRVFIGSFNFDERSARLNTEMGFLIDSPELAQGLADWFLREVPDRSYRVELVGRRKLRWREWREDAEIVHDVEPGTRFWRRAWVACLAWLPIDRLL